LIEVYETDLKLSNVSNKDGEALIHKLDIDKSLFIDGDVFQGDPDKEDYEGHMGNAAASATHYYCKAAVLIVPKIFSKALMWHTMQNGELEILPFLADLRDQVTNAPSDQKLRDQLFGVCRNIVASYGTEPKLRVSDYRTMYSYGRWDSPRSTTLSYAILLLKSHSATGIGISSSPP
jgi:hypothetical protein